MKKYMFLFVILFCIMTLCLKTIVADTYLPLLGRLVVIDPGHGNVDPGTVVGNIYEKDINLQISLLLKKSLEKMGAAVIMTRDGDYDLASPNATYRKRSDFNNRILLINNSGADLYLSIHLNYLSYANYYGPQVFYYGKNNLNLAKQMQQVLNKKLQGMRDIKLIPQDTYMYNKLNVSGILIECGFLSNSKERKKLQEKSYQKQISKAITEGLVLYFT